MVKPYFCGLDFGTSNSAMSCGSCERDVNLIPLEEHNIALPSAVFFNFEVRQTVYGREAMAQYLSGYEGRLLRSLKSILGSELINESTQIDTRKIDFRQIIGLFIYHIKKTAEAYMDAPLDYAVVGRPVKFVDDNPEADHRAQSELEEIARAQGFSEVRFEYEPIAAARDYESGITDEELVLVFDIGGGTSDFSVIRLSPERREASNRERDILANDGVHLGGTNLDRKLSLETIMPDLGYGSNLLSGLTMPNTPYFELSTWHLINRLYTRKSKSGTRSLLTEVEDRRPIERFIKIQENERGHEIAEKVEAAKIALSEMERAVIDLSDIEAGWINKMDVRQLEKAIYQDLDKIMETAASAVINGAGLQLSDIDVIFMTGGSTGLPGFENKVRAMFPAARIHYGDRFSSVAKGLGLTAAKIFAG